MLRHRRSPNFAWLTILFCLCAIAFSASACRQSARLPDVTSSEYRTTVSAFYTGLSALQVGDDSRAECYLTYTTQLAPDEPAGWANLGLLALRQRELDRAFEKLEQARTLAPDNASILVLLASVESNRGRFTEAISLLRHAVESDDANLRARFALAAEIERAGGANNEASDREAQTLLASILERQPDNLAVLLESARLAAKRGDAETLRRTVARIGAQPALRAPEAQEQFRALQTAAESANPRLAATRVAFMRNVLVRTTQFRQSLLAVRTPVEEAGEPLARFVRLPSPASDPAAPDAGITFNAEELISESGESNAVVQNWSWSGVISLTGEGAPMPLVARGETVRLASGARLTFPGGTTQSEPKLNGVLGADLNYDFKTDLIFAGAGGVRLFRQEDANRWSDVTARAGLPTTVTNAAYAGAWAADVDLDGDLDVVLGRAEGAPLALRNNGDDTFNPLEIFSSVARLRGFAWADVDADGDPDAVLLDEPGRVAVFANELGGQFSARPFPQNTSRALAIGVADANRDGALDVLTLNADGAIHRFSFNEQGGWSATEIARWSGAPFSTNNATTDLARLFVADMDNNGGLDLVAAYEGATRLWLSDARGEFGALNVDVGVRVFAVADANTDGRLDLIGVGQTNQPVRALNGGTRNYHWQIIRPRAQQATGDQRINSFGIGGEMEIRAGLQTQKQIITSPLVHFGLGEQATADVVRIVWPNGSVRAEFDLRADQVVLAEQRLKGSCPSLFAYNGREMDFVKDCAPWSPALGLRINAQETAGILQTEEWMKIRGDQLAPRRDEAGSGYYDLRITAELWETYYLDHYSLMVIDHPSNTEIFVDERFSVPPPQLAVHTFDHPRSFARAQDDLGADVTDIVREQDARYLDTFGRGTYQGVTRDHWVELELPEDAPSTGEPLWLIGHGWLHPTDASINVALSQGRHTPPRSLSLEVADGRGGWHVAQPNLGFPAGKNKTILINLQNVFLPNAPRRLRLRTNMEIFWDKLEWAQNLSNVESVTQRLAPGMAELQYRGFSVMEQTDRSSPEVPRYNAIAGTAARWRDLAGYYTRFGDIRELLAGVDDRIVIVNAGDEIRLRFPAPPAPPAGWRRDFILVGNGWIKDGDYNSVFSQSVLPLPARDIADYTTLPARLEDDPVYRRHAEDWQTFHTRYVTPQRFQNALQVR